MTAFAVRNFVGGTPGAAVTASGEWTLPAWAGSSHVYTDDDQARTSGSSRRADLDVTSASGPDCTYLCTFVIESNAASSQAEAIVRASDSVQTYVGVRAARSGSTSLSWQLYECIAGVYAQLGSSVGITVAAGETHTMLADAAGSNASLYADGVGSPTIGPLSTTVDGTSVGGLHVGFTTMDAGASNTTRYHYISFAGDEGGGTAHASAGDLVGSGSVIAGSAAHVAVHPTSGVLVGPGSTVAGAAARTRIHPSSGALVGPGSVIAGDADHTTPGSDHATTGALVGPGSAISGSAAHIAVHQTAGDLIGPGALVSGAAQRTPAPVTHSTSGDIVGPGSAVSGQASHTNPNAASAGGGVPWNVYRKTGETEDQKRARRVAQGIVKALERGEDIQKLARKAVPVAEFLKDDIARLDRAAEQYARALDRRSELMARNDALATRQMQAKLIDTQLQAEREAQLAEELDMVFLVASLVAMED